MQESEQSQLENFKSASKLLDDEVRVCDTCGDVGHEHLLVLCNKCPDGAAHTYCMRVMLDKLPEGGCTCEECMLGIDTKKAVQDEEAATISKGHEECQKSESSSKLTSRSSVGRSGTNSVSCATQLSAKRHAAPLKVQYEKRSKVVGKNAVPTKSSKPGEKSLPHTDISSKNLKGKMKSAEGVTSMPQCSSNSQERKVRYACGDNRNVGILETESDKNTKAPETSVISPKIFKKCKSKTLQKERLESTQSVTSLKQSSYGTQGKAESSSIIGGKSLKLGLLKRTSQDKCPPLKSRPSNAVDLKLKGKMAEGSLLQKHKDALSGAYNDHLKGKDSRVASNSPSLDNVSSNKSNVTDSKVLLASASPPKASFKSSCAKERKTSKRNATDSEILHASASRSKALNKLSCAKELKIAKRNETSHLHIPAVSVPASDSGVISVEGGKETESGEKTSLSGSNCYKLNALQSCGQLDSKSKSSCGITHKDLNCANEEHRNSSRQVESLEEVATPMEKHKYYIDLPGDKISTGTSPVPYMAAIPSHKDLNCANKEKRNSNQIVESLEEVGVPTNICAGHAGGDISSGTHLVPYMAAILSQKDLNGERNLIQIAESPEEAALPMEKDKSCTDLVMDEISSETNLVSYLATILSQDFIVPKPDYIWLGKFLIHGSARVASCCDGVQAHLSTHASPKVLEVVDKLPEMITLEELPRLRMWPSQFIESQATEENIALYFFAADLNSYTTHYAKLLEHMTKNDLALKGNLDGIELLIFPSNVLPEKSQRWNQLLFLWGVFRGRKVINSTSEQMTNPQEQESRDCGRKVTFDLNAYPQDEEEDIATDDEGGKYASSNNNGIGEFCEFDNTVINSTEERILLNGYEYSSGLPDPRQEVEEGGNRSVFKAADLGLKLWPKRATPNDDIVESTTSPELQGKTLMDESNDNNNADYGEALGCSCHKQDLELLERQAVEILVSFSKGCRKV